MRLEEVRDRYGPPPKDQQQEQQHPPHGELLGMKMSIEKVDEQARANQTAESTSNVANRC